MLKSQSGSILGAIAAARVADTANFEPQAIANRARAFATLSMHYEPLMPAIAAAFSARASEFKLQELASTAWAFAEMLVADAPLLEVISSAAIAQLKAEGAACNVQIVDMLLSVFTRLEEPRVAVHFLTSLQAADVKPGALGLGALLSKLEQHSMDHGSSRTDTLQEEINLLSGLRQGPGLRPAAVAAAAARLAEVGEAESALLQLQHLAVRGRGGLWRQVWLACGGDD